MADADHCVDFDTVISPPSICRRPEKLCITGEKWFASGELNVFRLSSAEVKSLFLIIM
jgi:hypothetical protein